LDVFALRIHNTVLRYPASLPPLPLVIAAACMHVHPARFALAMLPAPTPLTLLSLHAVASFR
jgi:hypothetical protein